MEDDTLLKIPDEILLKESRKEVGQLTSEVQHLTNENKKLLEEIRMLKSLSKGQLKDVKKEEKYKQMNQTIIERNQTIKKLKKDNSDLICKLVQS